MHAEPKKVFIDTNILLAATNQDRPEHAQCTAILEAMMSDAHTGYVNGQVLREYAVVATRPKVQNGLDLSPEAAADNIDTFRSILFILEETRSVADEPVRLIRTHELHGKRIHDANIAATVIAHGLSELLTSNPKDYAPFPEITCTRPEEFMI